MKVLARVLVEWINTSLAMAIRASRVILRVKSDRRTIKTTTLILAFDVSPNCSPRRMIPKYWLFYLFVAGSVRHVA